MSARPSGIVRSRISRWMARSCTVASAGVWPGLSRAMIFIHHCERPSRRLRSFRTSGSVPSGSAMSNERPTSDRRTLRRDADDRERHALDQHGLAHDIGCAAVAPLPHRVADHRHGPRRSAATNVVGLRQRAAGDGGDAEHLEHAPADPESLDHVRRGGRRQVEPIVAPREGVRGERLLPIADRLPDRIGPGVVGQQHELLRVADRQRLERQAVQDGEEGRHAADAEREREHAERRHHRRGAERSPRVAPVDCQGSAHAETSAALREREPHCVDDGVEPETGDGGGAVAARAIEVVLPAEQQALAEPLAGRRRTQPDERSEHVPGCHARPRRDEGRRPSSAATSAASRSRSSASTCLPRAVTR